MKCVFYATIPSLILLTISPVWGDDKKVMIRPADCHLLTTHIAEEGVAYKAGEDVRGKKIVPADLTPPADPESQDEYSFYLVRDVSKRPDLKQEIILGFVEVKDGKVSLNGKPLSGGQQKTLHAFCKRHVKDN